jgi:hypothetical protein
MREMTSDTGVVDRSSLLRSLEAHLQLPASGIAADALEDVARLLALRHFETEAAFFIGASERARETVGVRLRGISRARWEDLLDTIRGAIGHALFVRTVSHGRESDPDEAIANAIEVLRTLPHDEAPPDDQTTVGKNAGCATTSSP